MLIIAATGHRPNKLGGYGVGAAARLMTIAQEYLQEHRPDSVICGMAQGWDQAFGWAAVATGIPVHAAIPMTGQESQWPDDAKRRYHLLLEHCVSRTIVFPGGYCAYAMQMRNEWMVDRCNRVLAMWDGSPGGTANCIAYANKRGVDVFNVYNKGK